MQEILSEVTGTVWQVMAPVGSRVAEGDTVLVVESMKMEIPVCAPCAGTVAALDVGEGDPVSDGQRVAAIAP